MIHKVVRCFFGIIAVLAIACGLGSGCSYDNVDRDSRAGEATHTEPNRLGGITDGAHGAK